METESLKTAIAVLVALVITAIWLRRRYGPLGTVWMAALEKQFSFRMATLLKGLFIATGVLWLAVWLFTSPAQRAEWKSWFVENSPWAPVVDTTDGAAAGRQRAP